MTNTEGPLIAEDRERFRINAQKLILEGKAPAVGHGTLGVEALELLYRRASDPAYAADAVKLLHELQTHQVELDLLYDQTQRNDIQLTAEMIHYKSLYDLAPVPYLIVSRHGQIVDNNQAAASLLDHGTKQLTEHFLTDFLTLASRATVTALLNDLNPEAPELSCKVEMPSYSGENDHLTLKAKLSAVEDQILTVLLPGSNAPGY